MDAEFNSNSASYLSFSFEKNSRIFEILEPLKYSSAVGQGINVRILILYFINQCY